MAHPPLSGAARRMSIIRLADDVVSSAIDHRKETYRRREWRINTSPERRVASLDVYVTEAPEWWRQTVVGATRRLQNWWRLMAWRRRRSDRTRRFVAQRFILFMSEEETRSAVTIDWLATVEQRTRAALEDAARIDVRMMLTVINGFRLKHLCSMEAVDRGIQETSVSQWWGGTVSAARVRLVASHETTARATVKLQYELSTHVIALRRRFMDFVATKYSFAALCHEWLLAGRGSRPFVIDDDHLRPSAAATALRRMEIRRRKEHVLREEASARGQLEVTARQNLTCILSQATLCDPEARALAELHRIHRTIEQRRQAETSPLARKPDAGTARERPRMHIITSFTPSPPSPRGLPFPFVARRRR